MFLEHRELMTIKGPVPEEDYEIPFGQATVVREGTDASVVAISLMVHHTIRAAEQLAAEGISIEIIDPRTAAIPGGLQLVVFRVDLYSHH